MTCISRGLTEDLLPQISPRRIQRSHQVVLLLPPPAFDLLLTIDRIGGPIERLVVDEPIAPVAVNETLRVGVRVKPKPGLQTVRHAGVKNSPAAIGHHIYVERLHCDWEVPRRAAPASG